MHRLLRLTAALHAPAATALAALSLVGALTPVAAAQEEAATTRTLVVEPAALELEIGQSAELSATIRDAAGEPVDAPVLFFSRSRKSLTVDRDGKVSAIKPGSFEIVVRERRRQAGENQASRVGLGERLSVTIPVTVKLPDLASLEVRGLPNSAVYAGTTIQLTAEGTDVNGAGRAVTPTWSTSPAALASVDDLGEVTVHSPGAFEVSAEAEGKRASMTLTAAANPITRLVVEADNAAPKTGDVVHLRVDAFDAAGQIITDVPVEMTFRARTDDDLGPGASGQIEAVEGTARAWRFVAEQPGRYTFVASSGNAAGRLGAVATARDVAGKFTLVGHGRVDDTHTSDLWVWEGLDGRDYAVTGTWGANGDAHFWDVTDPANIERISTVTIDARTVNDVKVSADGRICVLSREGASDRKNGIVLVDVMDPRNPKILSGFDDSLTGGVHNVFIDGDKVYALSASARYDSIDISDPGSPQRVGTYKVERPNPSIHDVWVEDGLAYSSNWSDGVHIVDVGNGMAGGSPDNPVKISSYAYPSGWNHAAFPFRQQETGLFYVAAGDEAFPYGLNTEGKPTYPRGWIHFIDFSDLESPRECARYQVPEAGTHNLWIEDDVMYVAYYNAGLRAVDVSGELMGDAYRQGREIAWFLPDDPEGHIANAPMAWGPQPHKGHIFFSDWNSGLWAVKLER